MCYHYNFSVNLELVQLKEVCVCVKAHTQNTRATSAHPVPCPTAQDSSH